VAASPSPTLAIVFSPNGATPPDVVRDWLVGVGLAVTTVNGADELMAMCLRGRPRTVVFDGRADLEQTYAACRRLKHDSFTGIIPAVMIVEDSDDVCRNGFDAGADEVLRLSLSNAEAAVRLSVLLRRSDRDTFVHPSTRLPGTGEIEADITRRLATDEAFAVCYADLDHFKEFNDRYSYNDGDRVIRILAKILHDVIKGICGEQGFVGHIGGDDFIFNIPAAAVAETCGEVVAVFDALVPYQYSEQDRRAGYFFGKDRRGQLHRVPLMTVSIGVVTNERRRFVHAAQMSELATEMKSYAKTLDGSLYTVDRRQDGVAEPPIVVPRASTLGVAGAGENQ
jgi:diguanylate cyclase (GGDEF)-like protein